MGIITRLRLAFYVLIGLPVIGVGETTSARVAAIAARGLRQPAILTASEVRSVCASALTQALNQPLV